MNFLRPELASWLARWREPLVLGLGAAGCLGLALRAWSRGDPVLAIVLGGAALLLGLACRTARARVALARRLPGPGVVQVIERRIGYFGPFTGGFADIDALRRIEIVTSPAGPHAEDVHWRLWTAEALPLDIPAAASGAGALFDAFAPLPGIDWPAVVAAMSCTEAQVFRVWERPQPHAPDLPRREHLSIQP